MASSKMHPASPSGQEGQSHCHGVLPVLQVTEAENPAASENVFACVYCGKVFKSARGLGQHKARTHPAELNSERASAYTGRKTRWSKPEDEALLRHAAECLGTCSSQRELYTALMAFFPTRSQEAIKKRLQLLGWKPSSSGSAPQGESECETSSPVPNDSEVEDWVRLMQEHILKNLDQVVDDRLKSSTLRNLVDDWSSGLCDLSAAQCRLQELLSAVFPHTLKPKSKKRVAAVAPGMSRRRIRRAQYAVVQRLFKTNRKDWASTVLSGEWRTAHVGGARTVDGLHEYWAKLVSQPSDPDPRSVLCGDVSTDWSLLAPLAVDEVTKTLKEMGATAPGLDALTVKDLLRMNTVCLTQFLNALLLFQTPTAHLSKARLTLVPKKGAPEQPGDFRPIAVTSVLLRVLHKVLAKRWRCTIPLSPWQMAFQIRDGCTEASGALHCILRHAHTKVQPLAAAFIDVSKAFDTVSHETLLRTARRQGLPPPLQNYLCNLYDEGVTKIGDLSVRCGRGVRQGDPLSPLLFVSVMDEVLQNSKEDLGVEVNGRHVSHLLYADDLVIFAESEGRLQERLTALESALARAGMRINVNKSMGLTLVKDGKHKCLILLEKGYAMGTETLPPLKVGDEVTYLGLKFTWKGRVAPKSTRKLDNFLRQISEAPLKPRQRLLLLGSYAIPKLLHELTLGFAHRNTLATMDRYIRAYVRKWLQLPKDTSMGYLYTSERQGGLGLPCLSALVPLAQKARVEKLIKSEELPAQLIVGDKSFASLLRTVNRPIRLSASNTITNKMEAQAVFYDWMITSRDCSKLAGIPAHPTSYAVMGLDSNLAPGIFLRGTWLRAGVLATKARRSRGGRLLGADLACRSRCGAIESLDHILQTCAATHEVRCERHNRVARHLAKRLRRTGLAVHEEPVIPIGATYCKPDLLVRKNNSAYVLDVCIAAPNRLELTWRLKKEKYKTETVDSAVRSLLSTEGNVEHIPVILSNRGHLLSRTGAGLRKLGLSKRDLMDLCGLTILGSLKCYDVYTKGLNERMR